MKYIIEVETHCILYTERRKYDTKEEVIEAMKILLENFYMINNIKIYEEK